MADKVRDVKLDSELSSRTGNKTAKPVKNAMVAGEKKLKASTLKAFNRNVRKLNEGNGDIEEGNGDIEEVQDKMVPLRFAEPEEESRPEDDE